MSQNEHVKRLIKLAHENPSSRGRILPLIRDLQKFSSASFVNQTIKTAFTEESEQFVAWCLMKNDKWTQNEAQRVLDKIGVPFLAPGENKQTRGKLDKGELVKVDSTVNSSAKNTEVCERRDEQIGTVIDIDGNALVVEFVKGGKERFEGLQPGMSTGLKRYTPPGLGGSNNRATAEIVYISDKNAKPPTTRRLKQVQEYISKGVVKDESRDRIYHTGLITKQALNQKDGTYFFSLTSNQRANDWVSANTSKGQLLYLGILGHRPGGWKQEFAQMLAEDAAKGDSKDKDKKEDDK